jgi:hypothetical protein
MEQLAAWAPAIISAITAIYVAGRLTEKVSSHDKRLDKVETHVEENALAIARLDGRTITPHQW